MPPTDQLFPLPGIKTEVIFFKKQLDSSFHHLDHILISGPRGSGKNLFLQTVKDHFWYYDTIEVDCQADTFSCQFVDSVRQQYNEKRLVILDHFECFSQELYQRLINLMKMVRIVAITRDSETLPKELQDCFYASVKVPPLYSRRLDIPHFIAREFPQCRWSTTDLLRLVAYNWPGNLQELKRALSILHATHSLPPDIDKEIPKQRLLEIFKILLSNGLGEEDLALANEVCFNRIVPWADQYKVYADYIQLINTGDDNDYEKLNAVVGLEEFNSSTVNRKELLWAIDSFFKLVFGEDALSRKENLLDLPPFPPVALKVFVKANESVADWRPKNSYSNNWDFCFDPIQSFSRKLTQEGITAVKAFLAAGESACRRYIPRPEDIDIYQQLCIDNHLVTKTDSPFTCLGVIEEICCNAGPQLNENKNKPESHNEKAKKTKPKSSIREAVEWAADSLSSSGNTELLKRQNIRGFLKYLSSCLSEENPNFSEYIAERILMIKNIDGDCKIIMQDRTPEEKRHFRDTGKHKFFSKNRISAILSEWRNSN